MNKAHTLRQAGWPLLVGFATVTAAPVLAQAASGSGTPWFEDAAAEAGIEFVHQRAQAVRYWLPEIMSGGAAWLDYDGDGDPDLYLVQGGAPPADPADAGEPPDGQPGNLMLRNDGDGTFSDVSEESGAADRGYGMGAAVGDYDGDGDPDLYVTNVGPNVLYRNDGNGRFSDVTETAGVGDTAWGTSAVFFDADSDGDLDLFVANYVRWTADREIECYGGANERTYCHPNQYQGPAPDVLYRNDGDGTFSDVSRESGIWRAYGNGLGVVSADFNADGLQDVYVANDGMPNQLWINLGKGQFRDDALLAGAAVNMTGAAEAGMGVAAVDIENDGDLDLFMTHLRGETNTLYRNDGNASFDDSTATSGLAAPSIAFTGFGMGFSDFDHDGVLDLYIGNGRVGHSQKALVPGDPFAEPNQLFRGLGAGRFEEILPRGGTPAEVIDNTRATAHADYDGDGDIDIVVVNNGGPARLLKNTAGDRGNAVRFRVLDEAGRDTFGAQVRIGSGTGRQWRLIQTGYSYCAASEPLVHFGLGPRAQAEDVTVIWPDRSEQSFGALPAGALHELRRNPVSSMPAHRPPEDTGPARAANNGPTKESS
jgi:hypothetical protein